MDTTSVGEGCGLGLISRGRAEKASKGSGPGQNRGGEPGEANKRVSVEIIGALPRGNPSPLLKKLRYTAHFSSGLTSLLRI